MNKDYYLITIRVGYKYADNTTYNFGILDSVQDAILTVNKINRYLALLDLDCKDRLVQPTTIEINDIEMKIYGYGAEVDFEPVKMIDAIINI